MKKTISVLLMVAMLVTSILAIVPVSAAEPEGVGIDGSTDLTKLDLNGTYYLKEDITVKKMIDGAFTGKFNGNGKTVTLAAGDDGVAPRALFNKVEGGTVENLNITGTLDIKVSKDHAALALLASGTFKDIESTVKYTVNAESITTFNSKLGGIFAAVNNTATIDNCDYAGSIEAKMLNTEKEKWIVNYIGGIIGCIDVTNSQKIKLTNCDNSAPITLWHTSGTYLGGIIGCTTEVDLTIENCTNAGPIYYNQFTCRENANMSGIGGIIGTTIAKASNSGIAIYNCENKAEGTITVVGDEGYKGDGMVGDPQVGGIIGRANMLITLIIANCTNSADINCTHATKGWEGQGGIVGAIASAGTLSGQTTEVVSVSFISCVNNGDVTGAKAGGIAGVQSQYDQNIKSTITFEYCINNGKITGLVTDKAGNAKGGKAGGIFGAVQEGSSNHSPDWTFFKCKNTGEINGYTYAAGIAGQITEIKSGNNVSIDSCANLGAINGTSTAPVVGTNAYAGILGLVSSHDGLSKYTIKNSVSSGEVSLPADTPDGSYRAPIFFTTGVTLAAESTGNSYVNSDYTETQANATAKEADDIEATIENMVFTSATVFALDAVVAKAGTLVERDYTAASWAEVEAKVEAANAAKANREAANAQAAIDAATAALETAIAALAIQTPDLTELNKLIEEANGYLAQTELYTSRTLHNLNTAVEATKAEGALALNSLVDAHMAEIKHRIESLEKKEQKPPKDENKDEDDAPAATDAPVATDAPAATDAPKKKGCGSAIGATAVVLTAVLALGAGVSFKKKEN